MKTNQLELLDLISVYTRRFIKLLLRGEINTGEYHECKKSLAVLQQKLLHIQKVNARK